MKNFGRLLCYSARTIEDGVVPGEARGGTLRQLVVFACLEGLARAFPTFAPSARELKRFAWEEYQRAGHAAEAGGEDISQSLERAAHLIFQALAPTARAQLERQLDELSRLAPPLFREHARTFIASLTQAFTATEAFQQAVGHLRRQPSGPVPAVAPPLIPEARTPRSPAAHVPAAPADQAQLALKVVAGPDAGFERAFAGRQLITLGRLASGPDGTRFQLSQDRAVSRSHALIELNPPECLLRDLSKNGILLNNQRVDGEARLTDGAQLTLGRTTILIRLAGLAAAGPPSHRCQQCATPFRPEASAATPELCASCLGGRLQGPQPFPGLELISKLGEGGMGEVFLAKATASGELVAVKTLKPELAADNAKISAFLREARLGSRLHHPNAVRLYDGGCVGGIFFFILEYVPGRDAGATLKEQGAPFPAPVAISILRQVIGAVAEAHKQGLVHRDIKPENIMLVKQPTGFLAKLTDFGLMRSFEDHGLSFISRSGRAKGTPAYMPPEQVENARHVGPPADIYALGGTLHYLLTRRTPLDFSKAGHFAIPILEGEPIPLRKQLPGASKHLEQLILRCLEKEPAARFASIAELDQALTAIDLRP